MLNSTRILNVKIQETSKGEAILIGWETKSETAGSVRHLKAKILHARSFIMSCELWDYMH